MMKKIYSFLLVAVFLLVANLSFAQRASSFRINEVLVTNTDNYQDDFGKQGAWVELFNSSHGTADLGGCYLTDDINNPKKYFIPKGDILTKIKPQQHVIFWIDNKPTHGTFHVNFEFDPSKKNFIALFDSNGRTLIDSMTIPVMAPNVSFGLHTDGVRWEEVRNESGKRVKVDGAQVMARTTPSTNNLLKDQNATNERFLTNDPVGAGMSLTAMSVVFLALVALYLVFRMLGRSYVKKSKMNALKAQGLPTENVKSSTPVPGEASAEVYAAIAMALYMYNSDHGIHDVESTILTIDRVTRNYSPWSSKIYTLRQTPTVNKK